MKRLLLVVAAAVVVAGCTIGVAQGFVASQYAGTYKGTWTNQTTGATGPGSVTVALEPGSQLAKLTLEFGGNYLGIADPPPITMTGKYDANGAVVKGKDPIMGEYDITIDRNGKILGNLTGLVNGTIPEMTYTGSLTNGRIETDYKVKLADGRVMESIFRAEKVK